MTPKLLAVALALTLLPTVAMAACGPSDQHATSTQCAEGQIWDATSQSCTDAVSG